MQTLNGDNPTLIELVDYFSKSRTHAGRSGLPEVACFFEEKPSKVGRILENGSAKGPIVLDDRRDNQNYYASKIEDIVIVKESSACLDPTKGVTKYSFQRDHFHLNKFGSPNEADFITLSGVLRRFAKITLEIESMIFVSVELSF